MEFQYNPGVTRKLTYGLKSRIAKPLFSAGERAHLEEGLSYKPGDIIQACDGFNHRISEIFYSYWPSRRAGHGLFLEEIRFLTDDGEQHYWNSCCEPAWTAERVAKRLIDFYLDEKQVSESKANGWWTEKSEKMLDRLKNGLPICTPEGFPLKELK